jgi:nucleoid-associated protein YgaU
MTTRPAHRLTRWVARLLAVAVAAGIGVLGLPAPAQACTCAPLTLDEQAEMADAVFTGTLLNVRRLATTRSDTDQSVPRQLSYRVGVDRVYKGVLTQPEVAVVTEAFSAACGLGRLPVDRDYAFFVAAAGSDLNANLCGGTTRATDRVVARVEAALGEGSPVSAEESPPAAAEQTVLELSEPADFPRLAAPGAALALVGVLGLLVVGRVGRR